MKNILRNPQLVLKLHTAVVALAFLVMLVLKDKSALENAIYFLVMTASLPAGPVLDLLFFKAGSLFPKLLGSFEYALPIAVTAAVYLQWKLLLRFRSKS